MSAVDSSPLPSIRTGSQWVLEVSFFADAAETDPRLFADEDTFALVMAPMGFHQPEAERVYTVAGTHLTNVVQVDIAGNVTEAYAPGSYAVDLLRTTDPDNYETLYSAKLTMKRGLLLVSELGGGVELPDGGSSGARIVAGVKIKVVTGYTGGAAIAAQQALTAAALANLRAGEAGDAAEAANTAALYATNQGDAAANVVSGAGAILAAVPIAQAAEAGALGARDAARAAASKLKAMESKDFVFGIRDTIGAIAFGITKAGQAVVRSLKFSLPAWEWAIFPFVKDKNGYVALGFDRAGHAVFTAAQSSIDWIVTGVKAQIAALIASDPVQAVAEQYDTAFGIKDSAERIAFRLLRSGVTEVQRLDAKVVEPATLAVIRDALAIPETVLGRGEPADVPLALGLERVMMVDRLGSTGVRFMAEVDGDLQVFQTRRDVDDPGSIIAEATGPIQVIISLGDSKEAGGSGSALGDPVESLTPPYPYQALMLEYPAIRATPGTFVFDSGQANDIVPAHEEATPGETQGTGALRYLIDQEVAAGEYKITRAYYSSGASGSTTGQQLEGGQLYANAMAWLAKFTDLAAKYGREVECDFFFKMGTNDQTQRNAAYMVSTMGTLCTSLATDIPAITGQARAPRFIVSQTETPGNNRTGSGGGVAIGEIPRGQLDLAESRSDVFVAVCPYWFKDECGYSDGGTIGGLHNRNAGYRLDGEHIGEVIRVLEGGGTWKGFRPSAVTRSGAVIDIEFFADNLVGPLVLDTTWLPDGGNYGFAVYDQAGVELTINSVAIVPGELKARITLSADPGAAVDVAYCYKVGAGATGRAGTWGNLRDSAAIHTNAIAGGTRPHWALPFFKRTAS
ncbi:hypothetical protein [Phenylobacterium immobile]|uniref:hypothetical protein n=1 Tax=Phenylobacterium immobile TaxID=21 RepID=UPI000B309E0D|nr:hypothetical protein [Phenylobacterium immobile]